MTTDHRTSLKRLFTLQEWTAIMLIVLSVVVGGGSFYFWQHGLAESVRLNRMHHLAERIRSDLFLQIQQLFIAQFSAGKRKNRAYYQMMIREVEDKFNALRQTSASPEEDLAIQALQRIYKRIQLDMSNIFSNPYLSAGVGVKLFEPDFANNAIASFDQAYAELRKLLAQSHIILEKRIYTQLRIALFFGGLLFIIVFTVVIYLHRQFNTRFITPMRSLLHGTKVISKGDLSFHISANGASEVVQLSDAINTMAADLKNSQEHLLKQEKQAALGTLVPVIAHNIRNPLASIKASAEVIDGNETKSEFLELRSAILVTTERLERWINALISYLHPATPNLSKVRIITLLEAVLSLCTKTAEKKQIRFSMDCDASEAILADVDLLEQALYSLILNAIEASPVDGKIEITFIRTKDKGKLIIRDHGSGIPFYPNTFGLEPGPTTKKFGTGLGIPFVYKVCQLHNWELKFEKMHEDEQGTSVTIMLNHQVSTE